MIVAKENIKRETPSEERKVKLAIDMKSMARTGENVRSLSKQEKLELVQREKKSPRGSGANSPRGGLHGSPPKFAQNSGFPPGTSMHSPKYKRGSIPGDLTLSVG